MGEEGGEALAGDYSELKDLRISLDKRVVSGEEEVGGDAGFCLCFWMYLKGPINPSTVVLRQLRSDTNSEAPLLSLNEEGKLKLFPLLLSHEEVPPGNLVFPEHMINSPDVIGSLGDKWVHIGCEVSTRFMRLHINGAAVGEKYLSSFSKSPDHNIFEGISLAGNDGSDKRLEGYIHDLQIFPLSLYQNIADLSSKNIPIQLVLDCSRISDGVDEECNGVRNIVGGKASCRRKFSVDVALVDAFGLPVHKEFELIASLVYADNGTTVKKPLDSSEPPLLITSDGLEFPSTERTIKLIDGQASIKLKISQLSSKCENRLFRVHLYQTGGRRYPFLEAFSPPIRCISRSRHNKGSVVLGRKRSLSVGETEAMQLSNESPKAFEYDNEANEIMEANGHNPHATTNGVRFELHGASDTVLSDSESTDARKSVFRQSISDATVFKYCLEGTLERSLILRDVISYACDDDIMDFAEQISLYTGCCHHRRQILMAKELVNEANDSWRSISHGDNHVSWSVTILEIDRMFRKLSLSTSRGLSRKDFEVLRRISGCSDDLAREDFDRMWHFLFPVAFSLSKDHIRELWESVSPIWIEGIITKEEAEASLRVPGGNLEPGTFVLRFPTSRSWPHPDAGSLVVTYIGSDYSLHNRLLAIDEKEVNSRPLKELLLQEPELSHLGRVIREASKF